MECSFCNRPEKSIHSKRAHQIRCESNPDRIIVAPSYGNTGKKHSVETKQKLAALATKQHAEGKAYTLPTWSGKTHTAESRDRIPTQEQLNRVIDYGIRNP